MASTPEDVRKKLARFEATIARYMARLSADDIDDQVAQGGFLDDLQDLQAAVAQSVGSLNAGTWSPKRYKEDASGFTTVGKGKRGATTAAVDDEAKIAADEAELDEALTEIDRIAGELASFAENAGIEGLDAGDVEAWSHEQFMEQKVYGKQQAVADVIGPQVAAIAAALPGAKVKFRGSLARGLKSFRKPAAHGGVQQFDPSSFDADAFIEVPDDTWTTMRSWDPAGLGSKASLAVLIVAAQRRNAPLLASLRAVQQCEGQIRAGLGSVEGYSKSGSTAEFYVVVQSESASANQLEEGNPYPEGALAQIGMPALEAAAPHTGRHREIRGPVIFTGETHIEIDEESGRTQSTTEDARV
jgi:hypothetical protein